MDLTCVYDCHAPAAVAVAFFLVTAIVGGYAAHTSARALWFTLPYTTLASSVWITGGQASTPDSLALLATALTMIAGAIFARRAGPVAASRRASIIVGSHACFLAILIIGYADVALRLATASATGPLLAAWFTAAPANLLLAVALLVTASLLMYALSRRPRWWVPAFVGWLATLAAVFAPLAWQDGVGVDYVAFLAIVALPTVVPVWTAWPTLRAQA